MITTEDIVWIIHIWWKNYSKYELLSIIAEVFEIPCTIIEDNKEIKNMTLLPNMKYSFFNPTETIKTQLIELKSFYKI